MLKPLTLISLLFLSFPTHSQILSFNELLDLFRQGSGQVINEPTATKYFDFQYFDMAPKMKTGKILWQTKEIIALTTNIPCGAGGYCESGSVSTFTKSGELIDRAAYESGYGDCVFSKDRENIFVSDSLLIFTYLDREIKNCTGEEIVIKNDLRVESVLIKQGKFERPIKRTIDTRRKYYFGSSNFLKERELAKYSKEELATIRNEIFAAHGYTFDTPKWQEYFSKQEWYKPIDKEIDDYLSMIERHNVKVLLKAEGK